VRRIDWYPLIRFAWGSAVVLFVVCGTLYMVRGHHLLDSAAPFVAFLLFVGAVWVSEERQMRRR
jgi:hypothetical protein